MILFVIFSLLTLFTVCFLIALVFAIIEGYKTAKNITKIVLENATKKDNKKP